MILDTAATKALEQDVIPVPWQEASYKAYLFSCRCVCGTTAPSVGHVYVSWGGVCSAGSPQHYKPSNCFSGRSFCRIECLEEGSGGLRSAVCNSVLSAREDRSRLGVYTEGLCKNTHMS